MGRMLFIQYLYEYMYMYINIFAQIVLILLLIFTPTGSNTIFMSKLICFWLLFIIDIFEIVPYFLYYNSVRISYPTEKKYSEKNKYQY
jgi:hypothetical protein